MHVGLFQPMPALGSHSAQASAALKGNGLDARSWPKVICSEIRVARVSNSLRIVFQVYVYV